MDFGKAALLIAAVFGIIEFGKRFLGPKLSSDSRIVAALALVVGQAATWLMSETVWAHSQVVGDQPLDEMNTASLILVGMFVAGAAAFGSEFLTSVRNMGQNQPMSLDKVRANIAANPDAHAQEPVPPSTGVSQEYVFEQTPDA